MAVRSAALLVAVLAFAPVARAHHGSSLFLVVEGDGAELRLVARGTVLDFAAALEVAPRVRPLPALYRAQADTVAGKLAAYVTLVCDRVHVCALRGKRLTVEGDSVRIELRYRCPRAGGPLELQYDFLFDSDPLHRAFVTARLRPGAAPVHDLFTSARRRLRLERPPSAAEAARTFLLLGVEHIFTGYDHLLFLFALLLVAAGRRPGEPQPSWRGGLGHLVGIVSAFTLAHSLTLALAALRLVSLGPRLVEPAIALTIVYVGMENIVSGGQLGTRRRAALTFAFGLVHGFGFAHVLREVGLPEGHLALALLCFNLGVELGQLAIVALLFPAVHLLARSSLGRERRYERIVIRGGSAVVTVFGLLWLAERLLGVSLLGPGGVG